MTSIPDKILALQKAAARLARSNGDAWELFIRELDKYVEMQRDKVLYAAPETFLNQQGQAQEAVALCKTLKEANATVSKLENK